MAREEKVWEYAMDAGFTPLEDRCIIVKGAAGDLSEKIVRFFETWDMAVLQMCENELILLPFESFWGTLERDVSLVIPYADIESVKLIDDLLNVVIDIETSTGGVRLTTHVSATAKSAERATLSRRRRPRFPAGGATALWPPALPRAAAQGALDRGVVEVRGPDLNLQRRGALGVPGRDRPARDLPSAELREPDRHRDVLCAERGQPPRGVRGPHDCPLSGSPSPSAASASRSFMR